MSRYSVEHPIRPYSTHGVLARLVGRNQCVLDVGCNEGYLGRLCDRSNTFYGLDNDQASLMKAKTFYTDTARIDLNQTLLLPWSMKFDVIVFGDVLEHLVEPRTAYQVFLKNYIKPGGRIIISLPNIANWAIRLRLLLGQFEYQETGILDRTHLHFFTFKTAREIFESDTIKVRLITGGSNILGWLIQVLPFTKSLFAHTIIMELIHTPDEG